MTGTSPLKKENNLGLSLQQQRLRLSLSSRVLPLCSTSQRVEDALLQVSYCPRTSQDMQGMEDGAHACLTFPCYQNMARGSIQRMKSMLYLRPHLFCNTQQASLPRFSKPEFQEREESDFHCLHKFFFLSFTPPFITTNPLPVSSF